MRIGSEEHKQLFCQSFMDSYQEYEPESLPWPTLDSEGLALIRGIPFWDKARDAEGKAGVMVSAFAETIADPTIHEAIALQGKEEARHSRLIRTLIDRYDIEVSPAPEVKIPENIETAFMNFGFEECLDSFFAFGLFAIAREAGVFPEAFFTIFDPIMDEEARHIVFFVNWFTYTQMQRGWTFTPLRAIKTVQHYNYALGNLIDAFAGAKKKKSGQSAGKKKKTGFAAMNAQAFMADLTPEKFIATCLRENELRMSKFDARLMQPMLLPRLSSLALPIAQLWPKQKRQGVPSLG